MKYDRTIPVKFVGMKMGTTHKYYTYIFINILHFVNLKSYLYGGQFLHAQILIEK